MIFRDPPRDVTCGGRGIQECDVQPLLKMVSKGLRLQQQKLPVPQVQLVRLTALHRHLRPTYGYWQAGAALLQLKLARNGNFVEEAGKINPRSY